jgi:hypothetical protein
MYFRSDTYIKCEVTDFILVTQQRLSKSNGKNAGNKTYNGTLMRNSYGRPSHDTPRWRCDENLNMDSIGYRA